MEENRVSFSSNGAGVMLHTKSNNIHFSTEEYGYYESLFKIADTQNDGILCVCSSSVVTLLLRIDIPWKDIIQAVKLVTEVLPSTSSTPPSTSPSFSSVLRTGLPGGNPSAVVSDISNTAPNIFLKFHHWLLLCKLLACFKQHRRESLTACLAMMDKSDAQLRFRLSKILHKFSDGECYKDFASHVSGWRTYGEDYQSQHVKYQLTTYTTLVNRTSIAVVSSGAGAASTLSAASAASDATSPAHLALTPPLYSPDRHVVERRYSEFETLVQVLHRTCPGRVVPPLPLKDSRYLTAIDIIATRRQHELQFFLHDLCRHPSLKLSFALAVFLEASGSGLRVFNDLASAMMTHPAVGRSAGASGGAGEHVHNGRPPSSTREDAQEAGGVTKKLWSNGVSLLSSGVSVLSAHAKSFDLVNSIWSTVSKGISTITAPFSPSPDVQLEEKGRFFDRVERCAKEVEQGVQSETAAAEERERLAESLKTMSELARSPELAKCLQAVHVALESSSRSSRVHCAAQAVRTVYPLNYLGRFNEAFREVIAQRMAAQEARLSADRQETDAKRLVDQLSLLQQQQYHHHMDDDDTAAQEPDKGSQQKLNAAKVRLAEAEHLHDRRRQDEERLVRTIHEEHQRLLLDHRASLLVHLRNMAETRLAETRASLQVWEACRATLQSSS